MNTTPDFDLMFLVAKRDMAEQDRNNLQRNLSRAKALSNRLNLLNAPAHERVRAKHMVKCLENEVETAIDKLTSLRAEVLELDWSQA